MAPHPPRTCRLVTLGCKVNQYDTQELREALWAQGHRDAAAHEPAELCVVNTCTVTARSDQKARQLIRRIVRDNPGADVVVIGCYAVRDPERLRAIPGVREVVSDRGELGAALRRLGVHAEPRGIATFSQRHRAWVKVQDGCRYRCAYCIVPYVRPTPQSRPVPDVVDEVRRLVDAGYHEVVLTGVHLGHYGLDPGAAPGPSVRLPDLLDRLAHLHGEFRIRLSSLEAAELNEPLLAVMARYPQRICPHLHVALQSGSDRVLKRMNRPYRMRSFLEHVERTRQRLDEPALGADVIVGFPGETEADFRDTCRVVRQVGFSRLHVFPFSARPGTPAATWPDSLPRGVVRDRKEVLADIGRDLADRFLHQLVGRRMQVLVEGRTGDPDAAWQGTADRYVCVHLHGPSTGVGQLVQVNGRAVVDHVLLAGVAEAWDLGAET